MLKLPEQYKNKEILYRRLILFTFGLGLVIAYIPQILGLIGKAIWICLPFIIGSILAFVLTVFSRVLMRFAKYTLKMEDPEKHLLAFKCASLIILLGFVSLLVAFIIPQLLKSIENLAGQAPAYLVQMFDRIYDLKDKNALLAGWLEANEKLFKDIPTLVHKIVSFLFAGFAGPGLVSIQTFISNTFSWIWITFISIAFSFVAFFNAPRFGRELSMIFKAYLPENAYDNAADFVHLVEEVFTQYLGGTVLECIILATIISICGLILHIPYAILAGVFCGICALVPMFGATAGAVICALLMSIASPGKALTFIVMFILIQQVEGNFIYPNVVGKTTGLPPLFVIVAVTIGASTAGILGMVICIPVASVIYGLILRHAIRKTKERESQQQTDPSLEQAARAFENALKPSEQVIIPQTAPGTDSGTGNNQDQISIASQAEHVRLEKQTKTEAENGPEKQMETETENRLDKQTKTDYDNQQTKEKNSKM